MQSTERLETTLAGAQQQQEQVQASIEQTVESLKPQIELMVIVSVLAIAVYILLKLLDSLHKRRVEKAILRIDRNLELLVADNKPTKSDTEG